MTFAESVASAEGQYQQHRAAYVAALSPEQALQLMGMTHRRVVVLDKKGWSCELRRDE